MTELYLDSQRVDWLTLTTWDLGEFSKAKALYWEDWLREAAMYNKAMGKKGKHIVPKQERSSFLQYKGTTMNGVFFGAAKQGGSDHFVVRASGDRAHWMATNARQYDLTGMNCTRIDIQVTVPQPRHYSARVLQDLLEEYKERKGLRFKVQSITSSDGLDTVYIGSRQSQRFIRIYTKEVLGDLGRALRFEVEYKSSMANSIWQLMERGGVTAVCVREIGASIHRLPDNITMKSGVLDCFAKFSDGLGRGVTHAPEKVTNMTTRERWLNGTVYSSWVKLYNSHEGREAAVNFLNRLNEVVGNERA